MASEEHKRLADFIKSTHNQLRKESRLYGPMEAWERHLARTELLKNYATTMRELATNHWNEQTKDKPGGVNCRNEWIRSQCYNYFFKGEKESFIEREIRIRNKITGLENNVDSLANSKVERVANAGSLDSERSRIKLLDVGSCYNPLGSEKMFDVTPIDIAPSNDKVLQCDFLNVQLDTEMILSKDGKSIKQLKEASFDAVIFSLLLEYFPCPEQRFACCKKAYELLKENGILLIITPDSNHVGANANIIKSWRLVLSRLGFMRIVYEKLQHIHCLGFRKCIDKAVAARWAEIQVVRETDRFMSSDEKMYIPQDFSACLEPEKSQERVSYDSEELAKFFEELPCSEDFLE